MNVLVIGAGLMGRAIAYDLDRFSNFDKILLGDKDIQTRDSAKKFLKDTKVDVIPINVEKTNHLRNFFKKVDVAISAIPYRFNFTLAKMAIETKTHFVDLGGNNTIVKNERSLFSKAKKNDVTYGIVRQSGGHLTVESEPGRGSTFRVFLPRADGPAEGADTRQPGPTS